MTRTGLQKSDSRPQVWMGVVSVSTMSSVEGYTQAHATEEYDPPNVEVIPVVRGNDSHGNHLGVRLLEPGDAFYCHETHTQPVLRQLGEATFRLDPENPRNDLIAEFPKAVVLVSWHQLGLIHPDPETPPPAHFRLMKLTDKREIEIPRLLSPSLIRLFLSHGAAQRWARERAGELLALYTLNRDRLRRSRTG